MEASAAFDEKSAIISESGENDEKTKQKKSWMKYKK